jgi:TRAP-type C4-dicarboxylate transport system permease small subunit
MQHAARRLLGALFLAEAGLAGAAFVLLTGMLFADVVAREFLGNGIWGAQRIAVYAMVVAAMLGFSVTTHLNRHLTIEGAAALVPKGWAPAIGRVSDALSAAICLFLAYWSFVFVAGSYVTEERGMALEMLLWPIQAVIPWAFASAALRHLAFAAWPALKPAPEEIG